MSQLTDWQRRVLCSLENGEERLLQAIRPCRESETGWTLGAQRLPENHNSLVLNERGPALKVFWIRCYAGLGARLV